MIVIVYDPRYVNPNEIGRLIEEYSKQGIVATSVVHMNKAFRPLYIEGAEHEQERKDTEASRES